MISCILSMASVPRLDFSGSGSPINSPNGVEIRGVPLWGSRPASQGQYRAKLNAWLAGSAEDPRPGRGCFALYALRRTGTGAGRQGREAKRRGLHRVVRRHARSSRVELTLERRMHVQSS